MTFGSLFSGIGGLDLGLERAGMKCRWQVEIDPFCRRVLAKHWPEVPKYGDIRELTGGELGHVDLIAGGFPCQDVSLAGLRRGVGIGTRSGLYAEMVRIVCELQPRFVLMENVTGLLIPASPGEPAPISRVLGDLAEIGFDAEWRVLHSCELGAPHTRPRVFILAYPNGIGLQGLRPQFQEVLGGQSDLPAIRNASKGRWKEQLPSPVFCRGTDGIRDKSHRLRSLGNAVVPQVAQWIGERIMKVAA